MERKLINLRHFATIEEVLETHKDNFADNPEFGTQFASLGEKLKGLGYDVLINNKQAAEFIPSTRLSEVVSQRDNFKVQAELLSKELEKLKGSEGMSQEAQNKLQELIDANSTLQGQLEEASINMEIMTAASDAINPKDIVAFINRDKIVIDKAGRVQGVADEIARIRAEKPYMFGQALGGGNDKKSKAGGDVPGGQSGNGQAFNMNSAIRRAAGHTY